MSTAVVAIEGVLGNEDVVHGFYPLTDGIKLARALKSQYQVVLTTTRDDSRKIEGWLTLVGMTKPQHYEELVCRERQWSDLSEPVLQVEQVRTLRSRGFDIGMLVSSDPMAVLQATAVGVRSLLYASPAYHWEEFRPDYRRVPREWQQIEDELVRQKELRATDPRLTPNRED